MSDKTILEINLNEEYKIKIEEGNKFNESIFKDVYKEALTNVIEIVQHYESNKKSKYDDFNNIIAFTGERGKGKSSSMISFRDALIYKDHKEHEAFFEMPTMEREDSFMYRSYYYSHELIDYEFLKNKSFAGLDIIDPSLFRGESLFEIILAKMFQKFQTNISKNDCDINNEDKRNLIKHFQNVFQNLQIINSDRKDLYKKESIEVLSKLATSSNLRDGFKDLVKTYLDIFEKKKNFLVITIDDFDLSFSSTYSMLEDIRQYLIQPNIIVLLSLNKNQLFDGIHNEFIKEVHDKIVDLDVLKNRAGKYIEKLLPISRMIELPSFTVKNDRNNITSVIVKKYGHETDKYPLKNSNNLHDFLVQYLNSKLNLFIPIYKFRQNLIIPKTLREIKELIQNAEESDSNKFKKYILLKSYNELDRDYSKLFLGIETNENTALLIIEQFIINQFKDLDPKLVSLIRTTNPDHLSIGDLISLFENVEKQIDINNIKALKFIDYTKAFISLLISNNNLLKNTNRFLYNGFESRFPREYNIRRDWVKFNIENKLSEFKSDDSIFLVYSLIHFYGDSDYNYRNSTLNYFFRFFESFNQGILNPFSIFTNYLQIRDYFLFENINRENMNEEILKYDDIFLSKLDDPSFAQEFIEGISNYAFNLREKQPDDYFSLIYVYLYRGGIQTLETLSNKYKFLMNERIIDSYINFPLFKIWEKEMNKSNSVARRLINEMYESSKPDKNKKNNNDLNRIIIEYLKKDLLNKRILTNFKNKIKAIDSESTIIKHIEDFYVKLGTYKTLEDRARAHNNFVLRLRDFING
ncbi:hypothetical protein CMU78_09465 [Elizabethkingia anophelis]|nr:hypothetical protein [Elizabethkingia anophelis]MDV3686106.1 hypothetical protein [Elizabethkingia anophelis]MDV3783549.1 hypothetical protein [Elizabethkingia anophelis]MDV3808909.1 hypothetical protein [Elizabethkingia anophelis]MDV3815005.1 hypothetical protein [Elizabethkingia anophelis]